ncbi:MAG: VENN motif pre-toxin domain-containing protein [Paramuribaculum sp.]|nr:VENN motif pre-toxin domain-containing protein [Paramuribaculum sp.]
MKKLFLFLTILSVSCMSMLTSCQKSNADLIKEYEGVCKELVTATENGDFTKIATLAEKGQKLEKELSERDLTDEEKSQLIEIQSTVASGVISGAADGLSNMVESAANAAEKIMSDDSDE